MARDAAVGKGRRSGPLRRHAAGACLLQLAGSRRLPGQPLSFAYEMHDLVQPVHPLESSFAAALLGRDVLPVYGSEAAALIAGKTVLITGAGGSIGSEIVRQLRRLGAGVRLYFLDQDEYALYRLQMRLTARPLLDEPEYILADVTRQQQMRDLFAAIRPDLVFHAAAYKHLPLVERSPAAAILTNVRGTEIVARLCADHQVRRLLNISTDKAARPVSILGMTKRLAELRAARYATKRTVIASVRFGNVLGSRG
ncbi:MAG TPA: polysaccharide biosynthesis protein, partial [Dehalococcoidia bacterium]|nr:polysaccharide biosynthesis protein [Dehalococcoidia bacterium]